MPAEAGELVIDRFGRDPDVPGDLAVGHAADGFCQQRAHHVGALKPVRYMEGLGAEVSKARLALVTLYTVRALLAEEETGFFVTPSGRYRVVKPAVAVGTMRGCELSRCVAHTPCIAGHVPDAISEAQSTQSVVLSV